MTEQQPNQVSSLRKDSWSHFSILDILSGYTITSEDLLAFEFRRWHLINAALKKFEVIGPEYGRRWSGGFWLKVWDSPNVLKCLNRYPKNTVRSVIRKGTRQSFVERSLNASLSNNDVKDERDIKWDKNGEAVDPRVRDSATWKIFIVQRYAERHYS